MLNLDQLTTYLVYALVGYGSIILGFGLCRIVLFIAELIIEPICTYIVDVSLWLDSTQRPPEELKDPLLCLRNHLKAYIIHRTIRRAIAMQEIVSLFGDGHEISNMVIKVTLQKLILEGTIGVYPGDMIYYGNHLSGQTLVDTCRNKGMCSCVLLFVKFVLIGTLKIIRGLRGLMKLSQRNPDEPFCFTEDYHDNHSPMGIKAHNMEKQIDAILSDLIINDRLNLGTAKDIVAKDNDLLRKSVEVLLSRHISRGDFGVYPGGQIYIDPDRAHLLEKQDHSEVLLHNAEKEFENAVEDELKRKMKEGDVSLKEFISKIAMKDERMEAYLGIILHRIIKRDKLVIYSRQQVLKSSTFRH